MLGQGVGTGNNSDRSFQEDGNVLKLDSDNGCTTLQILLLKCHSVVYLKQVNFIACKLYLSKIGNNCLSFSVP